MLLLRQAIFLRFVFASFKGRHGRRPGEEESDVDIEGFEEDDDGKPKTPAPVRWKYIFTVLEMSFKCI